MGERTNIATHTITNSATGLDMRHLLGDNLLLNSQDEKENGGTNEGNDDVLSEEEFTTMGKNLQPKTSDPSIPIDPSLDSTLPSPYITATHPTPRRPEPKKARPNANRKSNTGSHVSAINDLDLSSHNSANGSSIRKRGPKDVFSFLELVNEASEKRKRLRDEGIEGTKIQTSQEKEETRRINSSYAKEELRRLEKKEKDAERKHELAMKKMELKLQLLEKKKIDTLRLQIHFLCQANNLRAKINVEIASLLLTKLLTTMVLPSFNACMYVYPLYLYYIFF